MAWPQDNKPKPPPQKLQPMEDDHTGRARAWFWIAAGIVLFWGGVAWLLLK